MILGIILLGKVFSYYARNLVPGSCQMLGSQPKSWQFMVSSHFLTAAISLQQPFPGSHAAFHSVVCERSKVQVWSLWQKFWPGCRWMWKCLTTEDHEHIISILDIHGRKANASWNIPDITTLKVFNLTASFNLILDFNLVLDRNLVLGSY